MQPVGGQQMSAPKRVAQKADPAPSRWSYRLQRLWLTPVFRKLLRVGVPFTVTLVAGLAYFADEARRDGVVLAIADMRTELYSRPEFMVQLMAVDGASESINEDIREIVPVDFPISSFDLDLERIRQDVLGLAAVKEASVRIRNGGVLQIDVSERQPVALWRTHEGVELIDGEGVALGQLEGAGHANLPIVAGQGADREIDEALKIFAAAAPLSDRLRGLVRMGERRWDVVLDRGQRIMLPEEAPIRALERVLVLNTAQDMLSRDVAAVDMRLAKRPTIRMNESAVEAWWKIREIAVGAEDKQ